jgi:hypothetical protein
VPGAAQLGLSSLFPRVQTVFQFLDQRCHRRAQTHGKSAHYLDRRCSLAALQKANVVAVQARLVGERFLRKPRFLASAPQDDAELLLGVHDFQANPKNTHSNPTNRNGLPTIVCEYSCVQQK